MGDETHSDIGDNNESGVDEPDRIAKIEDELFQYRMTLKHFSHQLPSFRDGLTLMIVNTLSSVFFLSAVAAGVAVLAGVYSITEAWGYIETIAIYYGIMAALLIGSFNIFLWALNWYGSFKGIREQEQPSEVNPE